MSKSSFGNENELCAWSSHEQTSAGRVSKSNSTRVFCWFAKLLNSGPIFWMVLPAQGKTMPWPLQNDPHRCFVVIVHRSPPRSGGLWWMRWLEVAWCWTLSSNQWTVSISKLRWRRICDVASLWRKQRDFLTKYVRPNLVFPTSCKYIYTVKRSRPHIQMYQNSMLCV